MGLSLTIAFELCALAIISGILGNFIAAYAIEYEKTNDIDEKKRIISIVLVLLCVVGFIIWLLMTIGSSAAIIPESQNQQFNLSVNFTCSSPYNCSSYILTAPFLSNCPPQPSCPNPTPCPKQIIQKYEVTVITIPHFFSNNNSI